MIPGFVGMYLVIILMSRTTFTLSLTAADIGAATTALVHKYKYIMVSPIQAEPKEPTHSFLNASFKICSGYIYVYRVGLNCLSYSKQPSSNRN